MKLKTKLIAFCRRGVSCGIWVVSKELLRCLVAGSETFGVLEVGAWNLFVACNLYLVSCLQVADSTATGVTIL